MFKFLLSLSCTFLLVGCHHSDDSFEVIHYEEDLNLAPANPDRGFYDSTYDLTTKYDYNPFLSAKENGYTLVYTQLSLENFTKTQELPSSLLDTIEENFTKIKTAKVKTIFRITYRGGSGEDPQKEILLSHLQQLQPLLEKNSYLISVVQIGLIGAYGEWHSFTGEFAETNIDFVKNRKDVVNALADIFPNKYLQIRTPMHKEQLFGNSQNYYTETTKAMITPKNAYSKKINTRIAHHNDCFLASSDDAGTYDGNNLDFWKDYVKNDSLYTPMGGETCQDSGSFTTCSNALRSLKNFHWAFLNDKYNPDVIQRWKEEGCYDEIAKKLGYRLVLQNMKYFQTSKKLLLKLFIKNQGFSAPYVNYNISFSLKNKSHLFNFPQKFDTRKIPAQEVTLLETELNISKIPAGEYKLFLDINDSSTPIRFANKDIWQKETQNNLLMTVTIP